MPAERLQKIIAAAGIASRRKAEELISAGHVKVNGTVVTELGTKADPDIDHIRVDGKLLQAASQVPKTYVVKVAGVPSAESLEKLRGGVSIATEDGRRVRTAPAGIRLIKE